MPVSVSGKSKRSLASSNLPVGSALASGVEASKAGSFRSATVAVSKISSRSRVGVLGPPVMLWMDLSIRGLSDRR